jgi:hypothetical protein
MTRISRMAASTAFLVGFRQVCHDAKALLSRPISRPGIPMRVLLTLALVAAAATSLTALAAPADAVGICTVGDLYNNMHDRCDGLVCYGYSNGQWQTCVGFANPCPPERCYPTP